MYIEKGLITSLNRDGQAWGGVCCFPLSDRGSSADKEMGGWEWSLQHEFYLQHADFMCLQDREMEGFKMNR